MRATVADYLGMLSKELSGDSYKKVGAQEGASAEASSKNRGRDREKAPNISAILIKEGLPAIDGYKPLFN